MPEPKTEEHEKPILADKHCHCGCGCKKGRGWMIATVILGVLLTISVTLNVVAIIMVARSAEETKKCEEKETQMVYPNMNDWYRGSNGYNGNNGNNGSYWNWGMPNMQNRDNDSSDSSEKKSDGSNSNKNLPQIQDNNNKKKQN